MTRGNMVSKAITGFKIAVLHQGAAAPAVGGVKKPFKPGGYTDSGSDVAYALSQRGEHVVTPSDHPDPANDKSWTFPDTVEGIRSALDKGANTFWANTVLHSQHALISMKDELSKNGVRMVGQSPALTEKWDDKANTNIWLGKQKGLEGGFPKSRVLYKKDDRERLQVDEDGLGWPRVMKPIRGRGSHGVAVVKDQEGFLKHLDTLFSESDAVLVEEFCSGEEITVTVLPPGEYTTVGSKSSHWALPVVQRVGHKDGVAPYSGLVAVTANSRTLPESETSSDPAYEAVQRRCELIANHCACFSIIRIDARRRNGTSGEFVIFDINMKPNVTGPGRPGRDEQTALTGMAAEPLGWDYQDFVYNLLRQANPIEEVLKV